MHKRSLIIGIGIGVIVGALLLQLFNLGSESQQKLEVISSEINGTESTTAVDSEQVLESPTASEPPLAPLEAEAPAAPELDEALRIEEESVEEVVVVMPTPVQTPEQVDIQQFVLRVHPGSPVSKTAKVLADHHIIQNETDFSSYMKQKKTEIRAGFFLVEENSTHEQLRKLLSGEPLTESERKTYIDVEKLSIIE